MTIYAGWYIYKQMNSARVVVWRKRRYVLYGCTRLISSAEAKTKGLSEDTVMAEIGGHKDFQEQELEDARSPILRNPSSYQNPYDIGYVLPFKHS